MTGNFSQHFIAKFAKLKCRENFMYMEVENVFLAADGHDGKGLQLRNFFKLERCALENS